MCYKIHIYKVAFTNYFLLIVTAWVQTVWYKSHLSPLVVKILDQINVQRGSGFLSYHRRAGCLSSWSDIIMSLQ